MRQHRSIASSFVLGVSVPVPVSVTVQVSVSACGVNNGRTERFGWHFIDSKS